MNDGHMTVMPGDRDRVPACAGYNAAIIAMTAPVNASALLELLGFSGGHCVFLFASVAHKSRRFLVERPVLEIIHDNADRDAVLWNAKFFCYRVNHRTRHIDRAGNFFSPCSFPLSEVIEHSNADRERTLLLGDPRMQPRVGVGSEYLIDPMNDFAS